MSITSDKRRLGKSGGVLIIRKVNWCGKSLLLQVFNALMSVIIIGIRAEVCSLKTEVK